MALLRPTSGRVNIILASVDCLNQCSSKLVGFIAKHSTSIFLSTVSVGHRLPGTYLGHSLGTTFLKRYHQFHSRTEKTMLSASTDACNTTIVRRISTSVQDIAPDCGNSCPSLKDKPDDDGGYTYRRAIQDLNLLQSNTQVIALAKYDKPDTIIPLFSRQLQLAGISLDRLDQLNVIHVSGTKGKGSTCALAESILRCSGLKTGFYNSPHLIKVTERIKINGLPIGECLFSKYFRDIFDRLMGETRNANITMPSYFSFLTILAFHIFLEEKVDCAIIEVGIGGEYDPTNVIRKPIVCGITTLDLDHTNILGSTINKIAWTKAGIIKTGAPIFTIDHEQKEALDVIRTRASERGCQMYICKPLDRIKNNLKLGIDGSVQYNNAALACQLASYFLRAKLRDKFPIELVGHEEQIVETSLNTLPDFFKEGLMSCRWPGRCQIIDYPPVVFFIDGAHTKKSMENCLDWFDAASKARQEDAIKILLVNIIGERDRSEILRPLTNYTGFEKVIFSTNRINPSGETSKSETFVNIQGPNSEKSLDNVKSNAKIWKSLMGTRGDSGPDVLLMANTLDSLEHLKDLSLREITGKEVHVLATGSLHFVGAILETLQMVNGTVVSNSHVK